MYFETSDASFATNQCERLSVSEGQFRSVCKDQDMVYHGCRRNCELKQATCCNSRTQKTHDKDIAHIFDAGSCLHQSFAQIVGPTFTYSYCLLCGDVCLAEFLGYHDKAQCYHTRNNVINHLLGLHVEVYQCPKDIVLRSFEKQLQVS